MKKQETLLRRLVREELAADGGPLGRIAFSPMRLDGVPKDEPNTTEEERLYHLLKMYVLDNRPLDDATAERARELIASGAYPDVFREPEVHVVYRGMSVSPEWLATALQVPVEELEKSRSRAADFTYTHLRGAASSWSITRAGAQSFTGVGRPKPKGQLGVVLAAEVGANPGVFLDLNDGLYNVKPMNIMSYEEEALALGPVKVSSVVWFK